jgi:hypothetical protein
MAGGTVAALANIAERERSSISPPERRLLVEVLTLVDAAEIQMSSRRQAGWARTSAATSAAFASTSA